MSRVWPWMALALVALAARGEVFRDGETVCFLGDSITHGGRFHRYISDYYLTRFPTRTVRFVNAGVSGDSAGGAMGRLDEDVLSKKPTSVAVMFGMNDVNRGSYVADPDVQKAAAQQAALDRYRANMDKLLERVRQEARPALWLVTPSPFDQTAVNDRNNNQPGCNDGLGRCASVMRDMAQKYGAQVVDFHGPMTAFNAERQKTDPAYTIVGPDRVHPGAPGHLMMAWLFLKAQGAPSLVSRVVIDTSAGQVAECANAAVSGLAKTGSGWSFHVLEQALPFPVDEAAQPVLPLLPIEQELNQEILAVKGLAAATFELRIDGVAVGRYTADEWSKGVNLALNPLAPQVRQAREVAQVNEARRAAETVLRDFAAVRWFLKHRQVNPDDLAALQTFVDTKMSKTGYYESKVPHYMKNWAKRGECADKVAALERQALELRKPVAHVYTLSPVP